MLTGQAVHIEALATPPMTSLYFPGGQSAHPLALKYVPIVHWDSQRTAPGKVEDFPGGQLRHLSRVAWLSKALYVPGVHSSLSVSLPGQ